MNFEACNLLRARDFCVLDIAELERAYPGPDFTRRDPGPHLEIVNRLLGWFAERNTVEGGADGMLYDARPAAPGSPENQAFYGPRRWNGSACP